MNVAKTDLVWMAKGLRLLQEIIAESPELINDYELNTLLICLEVLEKLEAEGINAYIDTGY
jgi:hypothetical protein